MSANRMPVIRNPDITKTRFTPRISMIDRREGASGTPAGRSVCRRSGPDANRLLRNPHVDRAGTNESASRIGYVRTLAHAAGWLATKYRGGVQPTSEIAEWNWMRKGQRHKTTSRPIAEGFCFVIPRKAQPVRFFTKVYFTEDSQRDLWRYDFFIVS